MDWHEKQINQSLRHANEHRNNVTLRTKDLSCRICYPINEETTDEKFRNFWEWYQGITSAERFSANAESVFEELMEKDMENIIEGRENFRINALIYSMGYRDNSGFSIKDIRARIVDMTSVNEKFTRDMEEAAESYKTKSSEEESSSKENSPKETSPKIEGSKLNEKETLEMTKDLERLRTLREERNRDVKKWDTSEDKILNDDEIDELRRETEMRRLRRMEKIKNVDELESIKSEENPYSTERMNLSLENLIESRSIKSEDLNSIKSEDLTKDTEKDFIKRKYKILKEKFGEEIEHTIVNYSKRLCERTIEYLEKKKILTKEERETLNFLKGRFDKIEESTTWREHTINEIYEGILLEEKENNKRERYNEKKRKYDRIKNKIGDEIDEELIKARERLRENIIQRIRYFEEKKMLTVREAQELEDLKRPEN